MTENEIRDVARQDARQNVAEALVRVQLLTQLAQSTIRSLVLLNGGAVVALFTLIGHESLPRAYDDLVVWRAFLSFLSALGLAVLAGALAYYAQTRYINASLLRAWTHQARSVGSKQQYEHRGVHRQGGITEFTAFLCAVLSVAGFALGSHYALYSVL